MTSITFTRRAALGLCIAGLTLAFASPGWALPPGAPNPKDPKFAEWVLDYVDDLHRAIRDALSSRQDLLDRRAKARARIVEEFSTARLVERTTSHLDRLVGR